jgi:hypothetical protein
MNSTSLPWARRAALLAINLLFLMVWGFAGLAKLNGMPSWFDGKFGKTFLATFPGLTPSFWLLAAAEVLAFLLAAAALVRGDFLERRQPSLLIWMLVWSLFVFVQLGFGQWLTAEYNGTAQLFGYFAGTLIALHFVQAKLGVVHETEHPLHSTTSALR